MISRIILMKTTLDIKSSINFWYFSMFRSAIIKIVKFMKKLCLIVIIFILIFKFESFYFTLSVDFVLFLLFYFQKLTLNFDLWTTIFCWETFKITLRLAFLFDINQLFSSSIEFNRLKASKVNKFAELLEF